MQWKSYRSWFCISLRCIGIAFLGRDATTVQCMFFFFFLYKGSFSVRLVCKQRVKRGQCAVLSTLNDDILGILFIWRSFCAVVFLLHVVYVVDYTCQQKYIAYSNSFWAYDAARLRSRNSSSGVAFSCLRNIQPVNIPFLCGMLWFSKHELCKGQGKSGSGQEKLTSCPPRSLFSTAGVV